MQISVESIWFDDPETLTLNVHMSDSVVTVKAHIHNVTGIAIKDQNLFFQDEKLMDTESLSRYGIGDGATLSMWLAVTIQYRTWVPLIATKINTEACYEFMRKGEKVGNIGCRLCWCWMSPASEESHWNSKNKHGKRLRAYTGPPDPNNFREVKTAGRGPANQDAEVQQDTT